MEGNIMFNLLYKKYKNDILKFSAWEELIGGCGQILGPGMTGRDKNVIY